jgi:hypothetical protein
MRPEVSAEKNVVRSNKQRQELVCGREGEDEAVT